MSIDPNELRKLADLSKDHPIDYTEVYAEHLHKAADEIERLLAREEHLLREIDRLQRQYCGPEDGE